MTIVRHIKSALFQPDLQPMFRARKDVFVDLLGWTVPVLDGQYEVDQFDNSDATYAMVLGRDSRHLGSARLLRTDRPHILGDLFPELCEDAPPSSPDILEITRFCLSRGGSAHVRRIVRNRLITDLVDHALAQSIRAYVGIANLAWLQQILAFGWHCEPLGLPLQVDGMRIGAFRIEIDEATPAKLAANGIYVAAGSPADAQLYAA